MRICISAFCLLALSRSVLTLETSFKSHLKERSLGEIPVLVRYCRYFFFQRSERENVLEGKKEKKKKIPKLNECTIRGLVVRPHSTYVMQNVTFCRCRTVIRTFAHLHLLYLFLPPISWSHECWHMLKEKETHTFKPFIPSVGPCDSLALALAARMTPLHLNRSFTRCCAINDWLPLRKTEGKTPALLVLQRRRLSGVQYYSNHSGGVSRTLSGMLGDWHLPASFTDLFVCGR